MQVLNLGDNQLVGTLPASLWQARVLHTLFLDSPDGAFFRVSGSLPADMGTAMPNLRHLSLVNQALTGTIPKSWAQLNCTNEYVTSTEPACDFWLNGNEFTGDLPVPVGCDVQWNELYLANISGSGLECSTFPCIKAAYWATDCDKSKCVKCPTATDHQANEVSLFV